MRTVLSKIEFRSGEGRGCNLSGSGRYPGNEAVSFYSELRWHHASSDNYELSSLLADGSFLIAFTSVLRSAEKSVMSTLLCRQRVMAKFKEYPIREYPVVEEVDPKKKVS